MIFTAIRPDFGLSKDVLRSVGLLAMLAALGGVVGNSVEYRSGESGHTRRPG
jgi:hypothetical protein